MQRRAALTPKKCPGQLSQVPTLKRLREYGIFNKPNKPNRSARYLAQHI
jgi:hypothetical protein